MIAIDKASGVAKYRQIYEALREDILRGSYRCDEHLPSIRVLAAELKVSQNSVSKAYQQLYAEGYVLGKSRSGYYVDPAALEFPSFEAAASDTAFLAGASSCGGVASAGPSSACASTVSVAYDFEYGDIPNNLLPWRQIRAAFDEALEVLGDASSYVEPFGLMGLREQLCRYLRRARGVKCTPEQIAVQSGTRDGLERLCHLFDPTCDVMAVEQPGYAGAVQVFRNNRFAIEPVRVDKDKETYFSDLEHAAAKLVYVTPSHQFPTGRIMPVGDRCRLIDWAARNDAYILEDDYDSEFRFTGSPIPALQSLDGSECVIYSGTISKVFSPGFRISYLVLPPHLVKPYRERLASYWCPVSLAMQKAFELLLDNGAYERQVRKQMKHYRCVQSALLSAMGGALSDVVSVSGEGSGLHLWLRLTDGKDSAAYLDKALQCGVKLYPPELYWMNKEDVDRSAMLMGYSSIGEADVERAIRLLEQAWL